MFTRTAWLTRWLLALGIWGMLGWAGNAQPPPPETATLPAELVPVRQGEPLPPMLPREAPVVLAATAHEFTFDFQYPAKVAYTFIPQGGVGGFGNNDLEVIARIAFGWDAEVAPLTFMPGVVVHGWSGPDSGNLLGTADLPARVFDTYLDIAWKAKLEEWLYVDLLVTPGWYGDFDASGPELFRLRGHGLVIYSLSSECQLVGGAVYLNRNRVKLLPAGGLVWRPSDEWNFQLVFPEPKIAKRCWADEAGSWWCYVAGEFGGGAWAIRHADGSDDSVDYNDIRILLGAERLDQSGAGFKIEVGYVFNRSIAYRNTLTPDVDPENALLVRVGVTY